MQCRQWVRPRWCSGHLLPRPDQTAAIIIIIIIIIINPPRTLINWSLYNHSRAQNKFSVSRLQWSVTAAAAPPPHSDKSVLTLAAHRDYSGYNHTLRCSYYSLHIHLQALPTRTIHESRQSHQPVPCVGLSTWSYTNNRWSESFDPLFYSVLSNSTRSSLSCESNNVLTRIRNNVSIFLDRNTADK